MALPDDYTIIELTSTNASIKEYIPWEFNGITELFVWYQDTVTGTVYYSSLADFTITEDVDGGGVFINIENVVAPVAVDVFIARQTPHTQTYTAMESQALDPEAFTEALDKAIKLIQEISEGYDDKSITSVNPFVIPDKVTRAGKFIYFDLNGDIQMVDVADFIDVIAFAMEWAINPEDVPVSVEAGGDGVTTFSALHWSAKSSASANSSALAAIAAQTAETNAQTAETNAGTSETNSASSAVAAGTSAANALLSELKAALWADEAEDVPVETGPDRFSAMHWALKAIGSGNLSVARITDTKAFNVDAIASVTGPQVRELNTINDPDGIVAAFAANQFDLDAGKYLIFIGAASYSALNGGIVYLEDTDPTFYFQGSTIFTAAAATTWSRGADIVDIASTKTFELKMNMTAAAAERLGRAHLIAARDNDYAEVIIIKIG